MESDQIAEGVYAYDVGQVPSQPVLITDTDRGKVGDLKDALKEMVMDSPGNQAVRVTEDDQCIGVQYIELDGSGGKEYTMPVQRIATSPSEIETDESNLLPHEYNAYLTLRSVLAEAARADEDFYLEVLSTAADSGIPQEALSVAQTEVAESFDL